MRHGAVSKRAGWTRLSAPSHKLSARWLHESSGYLVLHCGHPTANWPYYAELEGRMLLSHNGLAFPSLLHAMIAVEGVSTGRLEMKRPDWCPANRLLLRDCLPLQVAP